VGGTHQLGAVEASGIFSLLVTELGAPELEEILRFRHAWEAEASVKLRKGDITAHAAYDRRGRIYGADHEASDLARRVQAQLIAAGRVEPGEVELADGNYAGSGN
jgi:hypothetical protein